MKSKEELDSLKNEIDILNEKLSELSDEELSEVTGGVKLDFHNGTLPYSVALHRTFLYNTLCLPNPTEEEAQAVQTMREKTEEKFNEFAR